MEAAIDILGNRIRVAILGHLKAHGPSVRGDIAAALALVPSSVSNQLTILLDAGVIKTDPPVEQIRPGTRVLYAVVPERVEELYRTLGAALGLD